MFEKYLGYSCTLTATRIHNSPRKISPGSYTTDNIPMVCDTVKMSITLTEEKKQSIYRLCQNILSNYQVTIRDLAQTIGVIVSSFRAVPYGQLYYRELEKCKVQSLARSVGNFDRKAYISEKGADELQWWMRNIFDAFARIKLPPFDLTFFSDASLKDWRGTDQATEIGGRWNCMGNKCHINSLELQADFSV